jgi:hypothetical protein
MTPLPVPTASEGMHGGLLERILQQARLIAYGASLELDSLFDDDMGAPSAEDRCDFGLGQSLMFCLHRFRVSTWGVTGQSWMALGTLFCCRAGSHNFS